MTGLTSGSAASGGGCGKPFMSASHVPAGAPAGPLSLLSPIDTPGATAHTPLALPLAAWRQILGRAWTMSSVHGLSLLSAGVAFFAFLSLTPMITATVIAYGLWGDVEMVQEQMRSIETIAPPDVASLIDRQLLAAVTTNGQISGLALVVAFLFAIYGGSYAVGGMIGALNAINEEHATRGFFSLTLRAIWIALLAILTGVGGLTTASAFAWLQTR